MTGSHLDPLERAALPSRRAVLAGLGALGLGVLAGCRPSSEQTGPPGSTGAPGTGPATTLPPATSVAPVSSVPFDPDVPYWMQGNFAPVASEVEAFDLVVEGALPSGLDGLYVRNGSNPVAGSSAHWFLGDGMLHGVRLEAGRAAWYRNRWVRTPLLGRTDVLSGPGAGLAPGGPNNSSNTSVVWHAGRLLSLQEVGYPYEVSTEDLATVGVWDGAGALRTAFTAHPKRNPSTGDLHTFGYGFVPPHLTSFVVGADGAVRSVEAIDTPRSTMIHDFAITDRHAVFWDLPVVFSLELALQGRMPYSWEPSAGARVGVMPLGGPASSVRWYDIEPCYVFHGVNARSEGEDVVVDVCRLPSAFAGTDEVGGRGTVARWRIGASGVRAETLVDASWDLPTIDQRFVGRPFRHAWYAVTRPTEYAFEFAGVAHVDHVTGATQVWDPGPAESAGEALFVPASASAAEGEGWLLTFVFDRRTGTSSLAVLDAQDVPSGPVARVRLGHRVPYGFHGTWVPAGASGPG